MSGVTDLTLGLVVATRVVLLGIILILASACLAPMAAAEDSTVSGATGTTPTNASAPSLDPGGNPCRPTCSSG